MKRKRDDIESYTLTENINTISENNNNFLPNNISKSNKIESNISEKSIESSKQKHSINVKPNLPNDKLSDSEISESEDDDSSGIDHNVLIKKNPKIIPVEDTNDTRLTKLEHNRQMFRDIERHNYNFVTQHLNNHQKTKLNFQKRFKGGIRFDQSLDINE